MDPDVKTFITKHKLIRFGMMYCDKCSTLYSVDDRPVHECVTKPNVQPWEISKTLISDNDGNNKEQQY